MNLHKKGKRWIHFCHRKHLRHSLSPSVPEIHDLHLTSLQCFAVLCCLFFSIKMNYRIALGSRDKERLLWCRPEALSQWVGERNRVLWIFWSLCLTPLGFLMGRTICNFSQTYVAVCVCVCVRKERRREEEVKLGFIVHVWRWRRWRKWDREGVGISAIAVGNLNIDQACGVHFITLFSSRGPGVCRSSFCGQQSTRWLDELYLSKWTLLISTPCYMDHLGTWWVLDKTAWWISHRPKLPLLLS